MAYWGTRDICACVWTFDGFHTGWLRVSVDTLILQDA